MAATDAEKKAQKSRSSRYGISVREDGNVTKPSKWASLRDSQFADPVNFLFPIPDQSHASNAKSRFAQFGEKYNANSRRVVRGRLNRLLRKFGVEPIEEPNPEENEEFSGTLIGKIQLSEEEGDPSGTVVIPAVRLSTYQHPWYGTLNFDDDLFDSFIDNFTSDVLGTQMSINAEHRRGPLGDMALAWVNELFVDEDGVLNLKGEATKTGKQYLGEEYRYASIEFTDDFRDQETGINYGPTLVGCAATNIPFVHRNDPIEAPSLSHTTWGVLTPDNTSITPHDLDFWTGDPPPPSTEAQPSGTYIFVMPEALESEEETKEEADKETTMPDKKDVKPDETEETPPVVENERPQKADVQAVAALKLPNGETITAEQVAQLMADNAASKLTIKQDRIGKAIKAAEDRGVAPVVLNLARQILDACEPTAQPMITLNKNEEQETVNLFEAVEKLLSEIPGRIGELTYGQEGEAPPQEPQNQNPYADPGDLTLEEAEAKAKEYRRNSNHIPAVEDVEL